MARWFGVVAMVVAVAGRAEAQRDGYEGGRRSTASFMVGGSRYDFVETGTGLAGAIRFGLPSGRRFVIEPGVTFFSYKSALDDRISYVLPEVSLQLELLTGAFRPYVGVGGGFTEYLSGRGSSFGTLHAAGGFRASLGENWGVHGDVRLRSVDPFSRSMVDLLFGVSKAVGR